MCNTDAVISVVDDDESVRKSLQRLLRSMGFTVRTYASAQEFLHEGSLDDHGCVLVDVRMPEMDGLDLQKRLAESRTALPVLFMTAYEDPGVRSQAMQAGAQAFLQKPFSDQALTEALSLALGRSRQQISGNGGGNRDGQVRTEATGI